MKCCFAGADNFKCGICQLPPEHHSKRLFLKHFPFITTAPSTRKYTLLHCVASPSYTASRSEVGSLTRVLYWGSLPSIVARNWKDKNIKVLLWSKIDFYIYIFWYIKQKYSRFLLPTMTSFKSLIINVHQKCNNY